MDETLSSLVIIIDPSHLLWCHYPQYAALNCRTDEWERIWKKAVMAISKYHPDTWLDKLTETVINFPRDDWHPVWDSNMNRNLAMPVYTVASFLNSDHEHYILLALWCILSQFHTLHYAVYMKCSGSFFQLNIRSLESYSTLPTSLTATLTSVPSTV